MYLKLIFCCFPLNIKINIKSLCYCLTHFLGRKKLSEIVSILNPSQIEFKTQISSGFDELGWNVIEWNDFRLLLSQNKLKNFVLAKIWMRNKKMSFRKKADKAFLLLLRFLIKTSRISSLWIKKKKSIFVWSQTLKPDQAFFTKKYAQ